MKVDLDEPPLLSRLAPESPGRCARILNPSMFSMWLTKPNGQRQLLLRERSRLSVSQERGGRPDRERISQSPRIADRGPPRKRDP